MTTFRQLLNILESSTLTPAAQGRRFEEFCVAYLQADPFWSNEFDDVWLWQDWPQRPAGMADRGVDAVARRRGSGELVAIQCKFYQSTELLSWPSLSTFVGKLLSHPDFAAGLLMSTARQESKTALQELATTAKDVQIWRVDDFEESRVDWCDFVWDQPTQLTLRDQKELRDHQHKAIADVIKEFESGHDRGQLIMACGTGKTLTSLRLAEQLVGVGGSILFLVPSIGLLSQTVLAWANDANILLAPFAVCSDRHAGRRSRSEDLSVNDLPVPATTNVEALVADWKARSESERMSVVFSTYQSIDVIADAQKQGLGRFDLIVCDEAHRTTGATGPGDTPSAFTKVHDNTIVAGDRRVYMTATPRVYGDQTKRRGAEHDFVLCSMDDESVFGPRFHELSFGEAVQKNLLTDYKVLVLAVAEDAVSDAFQRQLSSDDGAELNLDDVAKMVGCWHGLNKHGPQFVDVNDAKPMRRAVAFSSRINHSKRFTDAFENVVGRALQNYGSNAVDVEAQHVDGRTSVKDRQESIAWLEEEPERDEEDPERDVCRVLSNAKCLTEGVDVPALDAVMFLNPRRSVVDVVQAVGRVMRRAENKEFGYVILPIGIPSDKTPEEALRDNKRYEIVWEVLQALRSHDERLRAEINKIDINRTSSQVSVIGVGVAGGDDVNDPGVRTVESGEIGQMSLDIADLAEVRDAIYARIVDKVGDRDYLQHWADDLATIAAALQTRIRSLLKHRDQHPDVVEHFDQFHTGLRTILNDSINEEDAILMLSQHLITRPLTDALFADAAFKEHNPISQVLQRVVDTLDAVNIDTETRELQDFYDHIRMLLDGIDTIEDKHRVIDELYQKFFKNVMPEAAASLGIVYTPTQVVDFILRSVNDLLAQHFDGASLSDEGVHILDPFAGTGTFITRLLQTGLINPDAIQHKYGREMHANEIVLLAYYISALKIETTYQTLTNNTSDSDENDVEIDSRYVPFEGMVLTDTFASTETRDTLDNYYFPHNNSRLDHQKGLNIRVVVGNPPYSIGQKSQNDNNPNLKYPELDVNIANTYVARSTVTSNTALYDSYVRAIRWASDRILATDDGGIVAYVVNGGWIDSTSGRGLRHTFTEEFDHIYIYNLRGNARTSGELRRSEGDSVFGGGSRATIAITLLVKQPGPANDQPATIHYHNIGDYLTRQQKLDYIAAASIASIDWKTIEPNIDHDWINQRDTRYPNFIPLHPTKNDAGDAIFDFTSLGIKTNRDAWIYGSSRTAVVENMKKTVAFYNAEVDRIYPQLDPTTTTAKRIERVQQLVDNDPTKISWNRSDYGRLANGKPVNVDPGLLREAQYRPFYQQHILFEPTLIETPGRFPKLLSLSLSARSSFPHGFTVAMPGTPFHVLATTVIPDSHLNGGGTDFFPQWQPGNDKHNKTLLSETNPARERESNINPTILTRFQNLYGSDIVDDDVFFYVYGILHSDDYRTQFKANLHKEAARIPVVANRDLFTHITTAGRELFNLHLNYDNSDVVESYPLTEKWVDDIHPDHPNFNLDRLRVSKKMKHPAGDRTQIVYNDYLTLSNIPQRVYDYQLGSRSAIGWIIDRWYPTTHKDSGIVNDVNAWGIEHNNPHYIIDLIKQAVTVSLRTLDITDALPTLGFDTDGIAHHADSGD